MKTAEMDISDIELSKKSKIIEIGSVEKSYGSLKLAKFWKFLEIPDFRIVKSGFAFQNCFRFSIWASDKKDKRKVIFYDTKELFLDDRLDDIFFTRSHRATVSRAV